MNFYFIIIIYLDHKIVKINKRKSFFLILFPPKNQMTIERERERERVNNISTQ